LHSAFLILKYRYRNSDSFRLERSHLHSAFLVPSLSGHKYRHIGISCVFGSKNLCFWIPYRDTNTRILEKSSVTTHSNGVPIHSNRQNGNSRVSKAPMSVSTLELFRSFSNKFKSLRLVRFESACNYSRAENQTNSFGNNQLRT
jgi:hypothetical protein